MVNWDDPSVIQDEYLSVIKIDHAATAIFLWEWVITLDFEFSVLMGKRAWKWPMLVLILARILALGFAICVLVGLNLTHEFSCAALMHVTQACGWGASFLSSVMIALRAIAIWERRSWILWLTVPSFMLYFSVCTWEIVTGMTGIWDASARSCVYTRTSQLRWTFLVAAVIDNLNLILVLAGLWILQPGGDYWRRVYQQGMIWIVVANVVYILPLVLDWINLNDPMNVMLDNVACFGLVICATRMYRNLYDYHSKLFARRHNFRLSQPEVGLPMSHHLDALTVASERLDWVPSSRVDSKNPDPKISTPDFHEETSSNYPASEIS